MQVTTAKQLATPVRAQQAPQPQESPASPKESVDEFKANSPDKNRIGFEVAYNVGAAVGEVFKGGSKVGQFINLSSTALGNKPGALSGTLGILGGALDVAIGSSTAKQSAINRNTLGCVMGGLQVAQGVATWTAIGATMFNAPGVVGQVAAVAALGAMAGRYAAIGAGAVSSHLHREEKATGNIPPGTSKLSLELRELPGVTQMGAENLEIQYPKGLFSTQAAISHTPQDQAEQEAREKEPRGFEKTFAAVNAVDSWAQKIGGVGVMMNNFDAIRNAPLSKIWAPIGLVGATYTLAQGLGGLKHSAVNRNTESTVTGALDVVGGVAAVAASMGAGRAAGITAAGAWVAKQAYTIYAQSQRLKGGKEDEGQSVAGALKDAIANSFWGASKENFKSDPPQGPFKSVDPSKEEKPPAETKEVKDPEEPGKAA